MTQWDSAASAHLQAVRSSLRDTGVEELLEAHVQAVWRRNVDGYDPLLGDTPLSLGIDCSENLRELLLRSCAGADTAWRSGGVVASTVDRSLRLEAAGVRLGLMKAPPAQTRTPDWTSATFHWEQESEVRRSAAERNSAAYLPVESDQADRQLTLPLESATGRDAAAMRDFVVVWSGQVEPALTAGWLGLPSLGRPGWFAVEQLWWEESSTDGARRPEETPQASSHSFADLPAPLPSLRLRNRRDTAADGQSL